MLDQFLAFFYILVEMLGSPTNLVILLGSSFLGILFGAMPGMTATLGVALLTTLTYGLETNTALMSLLGLYVGAIYGGSYPAVLINIPGTAASAATALDGYPMASRGEGGKALGLTTTASFIGTVIGLLFLVMLSPLIADLALEFTSFEFFLLAIFGILISGTLTSSDLVVKGWIAGMLGLFLATIGRDTLQFYPRFTFDQSELDSGLNVVPVLIGCFGIPQIIRVLVNREALGKAHEFGRILPELKTIIRNLRHIVRSALIGVGIGAVPGIGEDIAGWVSYGTAKNTAQDPETFGKGNATGLISSETANNACIGGALIPLLTLGIPGSAPAAMLLGALMLHGVNPGPTITTDHPNFLLEITAVMVLASLAMWINGMFLAKQVVKLLRIPAPLFMPVVGVLCVIGSYSLGLSIVNLYLMVPIGIAAYLLTEMKYPISPLVIGLILGPMADENLRRALLVTEGDLWPIFTRPVSCILTITIIYMVLVQLPPIKRLVHGLLDSLKQRLGIGISV
ncbi:tripartite tricarboxylate transporter permease [Aestuariirhabdus sp. LZHN29]|uniref:tripartite tricarboxylate transporter permease n=1 Tax=Aestuariirhabdus sp. LZHN29 TaxID=3417462 RepID=UPI003CEABF20